MGIVVVGLAATASGCVSSAWIRGDGGQLGFPGDDGMPQRLPAPDSSADAQVYLTASLAAMRAAKPQHAAIFLDAILRSDHLTDRGRANVYWLAAEAHRLAGHEEKLVDSLGGFLVAAQVLPPDDDISRREVEARSSLVARKVRTHPFLGKSPDDAIPVEDARDPPGIVAQLGCVEDNVSTIPDDLHERRLERRRVICYETGETQVLFFDVTATR